MLVEELMTPDPYTLRDDKRLLVARDMMEWGKFRHIPIVDEHGNLVGLVSRTDVLAASLPDHREDVPDAQIRMHLAGVPIRAVMQTEVQAIDPRATVVAAAQVMCRKKVNCLPVLDGRRLVGILTSHDFMRVVAAIEATPPRAAV